jgi:hypothetical protein
LTTLLTYRQRLATELGAFWASTATSGSSASALEDTAFPIKSTIAQDDLYADYYLLRPSAANAADRVRVVKTYDPANGKLNTDLPWSAVPYAGGVGEPYELHGVLEPGTVLPNLINEGLKRCMVVVEVTLSPVNGAMRTPLGTAISATLLDPRWVRQVGWLGPGDSREQFDPYARAVRGSCTSDDGGATYYINHPGRTFNTTDVIYVRLIKRAYDQCATAAGAYGTQAGLALDTDKCPVQPDWVAAAALVTAWSRYGHVLDAQGNQRVRVDQASAASWFSQLTKTYFSLPDLTFQTKVAWGPNWRSRGWGSSW